MSKPVINMSFDCGCGFRTDSLTTAAHHTRETEHTMTIHGSVKPEISKDSLAFLPPSKDEHGDKA